MGRMLRPMLPGVPFHITARTQWKEPLFAGAESQVCALVRRSTTRSDAKLLAFAVMSNHLHLVVLQGRRPLSSFMQPLLRSIAGLVNRGRTGTGHIFHGRYHHVACSDAEYFRSIIAYVHLNPVRAGICRQPEQSEWTSHRDYCAPGPIEDGGVTTGPGLRIFASETERSDADCRRDYVDYVSWRLAMDAYLNEEAEPWRPAPRAPLSVGGDLYWHHEFGTAQRLLLTGATDARRRREDLRDHIARNLHSVAPSLPFEDLRGGGRERELVRVRRIIIERALIAGYAPGRIAEFLGISPSSVSHVRAIMRGDA